MIPESIKREWAWLRMEKANKNVLMEDNSGGGLGLSLMGALLRGCVDTPDGVFILMPHWMRGAPGL